MQVLTKCILLHNVYYIFQFCDKTKYPTFMSLIGNMVMAAAFLFVGPAPFFNVKTSTGLIKGMLALAGFGYAFVVVSTFTRAESGALKKGFSDDIQTYLMISGIHQIIKSYYFINLLCFLMYVLSKGRRSKKLDYQNIKQLSFIEFHRNVVINLFFGKFSWPYSFWFFSGCIRF